MLETAIRDYLTSHPDVSPLVGSRIYPQVLPTSPELPAITYQRTSTQRSWTKDGPRGEARARIQYTCSALDYEVARQVAAAVRGALDGYTGVLNDIGIARITSMDQKDAYNSDLGVHQAILDVMVWHDE